MKSRLVKIPLSLTINVFVPDGENGRAADAVFEAAAGLLVTDEGMASNHTKTALINVDGHGRTKVFFNLGDLQLAGEPTVVG